MNQKHQFIVVHGTYFDNKIFANMKHIRNILITLKQNKSDSIYGQLLICLMYLGYHGF